MFERSPLLQGNRPFGRIISCNNRGVVYVKEQLSHASIQITVDTYGQLIPGANRAAGKTGGMRRR